MEPMALRQEQLNDVQVPLSLLAASARAAGASVGMSAAAAGVLGALHGKAADSTKLPPYDPTCPVSVAMSKLKSLMDHADPVAAAAAAEEEEQAAAAEAEKEKERERNAAESGKGAEGEVAATSVDEEEDEENEVPLECLRYFKLLNRGSQRSLMKQLISQLQRTACTPRDSLLGLGEATPRFLDANFPLSLGLSGTLFLSGRIHLLVILFEFCLLQV